MRGKSISGVVYQSSCRVGLLFALGSSSSRRRFSSDVSSSGSGASRSSGLPVMGCASLQRRRMQKVAVERWSILAVRAKTGDACGCAVQRVAHDRMAERLHVDADLVGAAGFDLQVKQGEVAGGGVQPLQHGVVRACGPRIVGPALASMAQARRDAAGLASRGLRWSCTGSRCAWSCVCGARGHGRWAGRSGRDRFSPRDAPERYSASQAMRSENISASARCEASLFATRIRPLVCLSRRCTMPGRSGPPTSLS